jgi:hypothetical protein
VLAQFCNSLYMPGFSAKRICSFNHEMSGKQLQKMFSLGLLPQLLLLLSWYIKCTGPSLHSQWHSTLWPKMPINTNFISLWGLGLKAKLQWKHSKWQNHTIPEFSVLWGLPHVFFMRIQLRMGTLCCYHIFWNIQKLETDTLMYMYVCTRMPFDTAKVWDSCL